MRIHTGQEVQNIITGMIRELLKKKVPEGTELKTIDLIKMAGFSTSDVDEDLFMLICADMGDIAGNYGILIDPTRSFFREDEKGIRPFTMAFRVHWM